MEKDKQKAGNPASKEAESWTSKKHSSREEIKQIPRQQTRETEGRTADRKQTTRQEKRKELQQTESR